jgi:hypothetical protein
MTRIIRGALLTVVAVSAIAAPAPLQAAAQWPNSFRGIANRRLSCWLPAHRPCRSAPGPCRVVGA